MSNATNLLFPNGVSFKIGSNSKSSSLNCHKVVTTPYSPYISFISSVTVSKQLIDETLTIREYFNKFIHSSLCSSDISDIDGIHE